MQNTGLYHRGLCKLKLDATWLPQVEETSVAKPYNHEISCASCTDAFDLLTHNNMYIYVIILKYNYFKTL